LWQWLSIGVTAPAGTAALALLLIWRAHVIEFSEVNHSCVATNVFRKALWMCFNLVALQVHLRFKNNKLFLQAIWVKASEMILMEVVLKSVVVNIVLLLAVGRTSVTDVAAFMFITAVSVQLVVAVEALTTEAAFGMSPETTLVDGSRLVITGLFVFAQLCWSKKLMLVCKDLLVTST
jgi:hypothetical protein